MYEATLSKAPFPQKQNKKKAQKFFIRKKGLEIKVQN